MIPLFKVGMNSSMDLITQTLQSGNITQGERVEEFEDALKQYFSHPYILTVNSATSGLTLALRLLNLQDGDQVLCTPLTCVATNMAVLASHLDIQWVDVDINTCNIDISCIERNITPKTKAIVVVHWGGNPIDMKSLNTIRDTWNIPIIEDCAHCFGATIKSVDDQDKDQHQDVKEQNVGTHDNIAVYSTQAIKYLTTGDGGFMLLPNKELYDRAKRLRWYGMDRKDRTQDVQEWGYKFHMNDINASIGITNLQIVQSFIEQQKKNAHYYNTQFNTLQYIQPIQHYDTSCYWLYTIRVRPLMISGDQRIYIRNNLKKFLESKNIQATQVHERNDKYSCFQQYQTCLPIMDILEQQMLCIPVGWWLTDEQIQLIVESIQQFDSIYSDYIIEPLSPNLQDTDSYLLLLQELIKVDLVNQLTTQEKIDRYNLVHGQNSIIFVLKHNNTMIATAKLLVELKFGDSVMHIEDVVVKKEYRNMGLGTLLLDYIVQFVKKSQTGYKIILSAKDIHQTFYERIGFVIEGKEYVYRLK